MTLHEAFNIADEKVRLQKIEIDAKTELIQRHGLEIEKLKHEIERLKEENAHSAWRDADKNKLISELADALEAPFEEWSDQSDLIQRAREATETK